MMSLRPLASATAYGSEEGAFGAAFFLGGLKSASPWLKPWPTVCSIPVRLMVRVFFVQDEIWWLRRGFVAGRAVWVVVAFGLHSGLRRKEKRFALTVSWHS